MEMGSLRLTEQYDLTTVPGMVECILDLLKINQRLSEQLTSTNRRLYGQSSEKSVYDGRTLLDEIEGGRAWLDSQGRAPDDQVPEPPQVAEPESRSARRPRSKREDLLPEDLEIRPVEHKLPEEELICPECGRKRKVIGHDTTDQIVVVPAHAYIRRHIREVCVCGHCNNTGESAHVQKAGMPRPPVPGSFAAPETLAWVIDQKYNLGLPLYRIEQSLAGQGIRISRQTLSGWMMASADLLEPVYDALHARLIAGDIIMLDDTPLQVLREPDKPAKSKSYAWVYRTDRFAPMQIILYDYQARHTMDGVKAFLQGFSGWLQGDGFPGYDQLPPEMRHVACLAHIRRKFHDARLNLPEDRRSGSLAQQGLNWCLALYAIEKGIRDLSPEHRKAVRLEKTLPILDDFEVWLREEAKYIGKTKTGDAIRCALGQFGNLRRCLEDGRLAIDNNLTEATGIKPFVMGRKAWLFSNTPRGAKASAILYSMVQTAKANGLIPPDFWVILY